MKRCTLLLYFLLIQVIGYAQTVTQTYTDRCTGEVKTFQIPIQGSTVIVFYNRAKTVTLADTQNGELQRWLEETYNWWRSLNPCSVAQAATTVTQIVTNSVSTVPTIPPAPAPPPAPTTPTTSTTSSSSSTSSSTQEQTTSETSSSSSSSSSESSETTSESTSESNSESSSEETSESSSEESSESEETSESEESSEEEEEEQSESKVQAPIVAANVAVMQNLDGTVNLVSSFGLSQSSLTGATTYSANLLVWDNLQQFALNLAKSNLIFDSNQNLKLINSLSVNLIYAFGTKVITFGTSDVFLGKKDTWTEGMAYGYAANLMGVFSDQITLTYALTAFATKPYSFKRYTISPLLALTTTPGLNLQTGRLSYQLGGVFGSNFDFSLTKRFKANIGGNLIKGVGTPMIYSITIGSKFQF